MYVPADLVLRRLASTEPALVTRLYDKVEKIYLDKAALALVAPAECGQDGEYRCDAEAYFELVAPALAAALGVPPESYLLIFLVAGVEPTD